MWALRLFKRRNMLISWKEDNHYSGVEVNVTLTMYAKTIFD